MNLGPDSFKFAKKASAVYLIVPPIAIKPVRVHVDNVCADVGEESAVMRYDQDGGRP